MKTIKIRIHPRLHIGLISMHLDGYRQNGGIGFAIREPSCALHVSRSPHFKLKDFRRFTMGNDERRVLGEIVERIFVHAKLNTNIEVHIEGGARDHVGMGMGTAIRLAVIEGLFLINSKHITRDELIKLSERGGTSGIGINSYFSGGLILDLGVQNDGSGFHPSSRGGKKRIPSKISTIRMPKWPLCVCVPRSLEPKTQDQEQRFFRSAAPVQPSHSYEAAYHSLFGIYAACMDRDLAGFCKSIDAMQRTAWKWAERQEFGNALKDLESSLRRRGADCVGMSSLGPLLYCFGAQHALDRLVRNTDILDCDILRTVPSNVGRKVYPD